MSSFFLIKNQKLSYNKIFLLPDEVRWEELKFLTAYVVIMHQLSFSTDVQADTPQDQTVERKSEIWKRNKRESTPVKYDAN